MAVMSDQIEAARAFKALHQNGFILPNAWDAGSARVLAAEGFEAIGTTSAGIAFAMGRQDHQVTDPSLAVTREEMYARIAEINEAVSVPVSADLEAGFGERPEAVAETVRMAIAAGLAGGNIEDKIPLMDALYDETLAVERIAAARDVIAATGGMFVLNARTDALLLNQPDAMAMAIRRANLFLGAGADCVFTPGPVDVPTVRTLANEIEGPLNIVVGLTGAHGNARDLIAAGARRVSVGGSLSRSALAFVRQCARELREQGTFTYAAGQISQSDLNALFAAKPASAESRRA
jgi:2-methylisocitrate lyase-like PEP mutase family enzyme